MIVWLNETGEPRRFSSWMLHISWSAHHVRWLLSCANIAGSPGSSQIASVAAEDGIDYLAVTFALTPNALK